MKCSREYPKTLVNIDPFLNAHDKESSFEIGHSANRLRDSYELRLYSGNVVNSRTVTWARVPPFVPGSTENVHSNSTVRGSRKLDRVRDGVVDEAVDEDESGQPAFYLRLLRLFHVEG